MVLNCTLLQLVSNVFSLRTKLTSRLLQYLTFVNAVKNESVTHTSVLIKSREENGAERVMT